MANEQDHAQIVEAALEGAFQRHRAGLTEALDGDVEEAIEIAADLAARLEFVAVLLPPALVAKIQTEGVTDEPAETSNGASEDSEDVPAGEVRAESSE